MAFWPSANVGAPASTRHSGNASLRQTAAPLPLIQLRQTRSAVAAKFPSYEFSSDGCIILVFLNLSAALSATGTTAELTHSQMSSLASDALETVIL